MKVIRTAGMVVAAVALVATGVGAAAGAGVFGAAAGAAGGTVAGISTATITAIGAYAGIGAAVLSAASQVAAPGVSTEGSATTFTTNPQSGLPYAMGRTRMSGLRIYAKTNSRPGYTKFNDLLWFGAMLSVGGPIQGIEQFTADNEAVTYDSTGNAIGTYRDFQAQKYSLGGPQTTALNTTLGGGTAPGWTTQHKLSGVAHAMWCLRYNKQGKMYGAGAPEPAWIGQWVKVYDPRKDSTYSGGSGSHRALDESTYEWSDNPGLHAITWALGRFQNGKRTCGIGAPVDTIRMADFVELANICEANAWTMGGVQWTTDSKWDIFKRILQAGGATPTQTNAMIGCLNSTPRTAVATIESYHLLDSFSVAMTQSRRDRYNTVIPRYVDEDSDWSLISGTAITVDEYVTQDGGQRTKEVDFPLVQVFSGADATQPGQLAAYQIVNSREAGPITFSTGPQWIGLKTGDVVNLNIPEEGFDNQPVLITKRSIDPSTGKVSFAATTETYSKHAFALGQSTTPPAPFALTAPDLVAPAPAETAFSVSGTTSGEGFPALLVAGESEMPSADAVVIDYRLTADGQADDANWTNSAILSATTTVRQVIAPLESQTRYDVRISYRVGTIDGDATIFTGAITGVGKITTIEAAQDDQAAKLAQLETDTAQAAIDIAAAQSTISQIQSDAAETTAAFQADIADLQATTAQIQQDAADTTDLLQGDIAALQSTTAQIQQDAAETTAALQGDISALQSTTSQIQQDAAQTTADLEAAQQDIAAQGASIQQAQSDILAAGGRIDTVEQTLGDQNATITSLSQTVNNQEGRLASAESKISTQGALISQNALAISNTQGDVASLSSTVSTQGASIAQNAQAISTTQGDLASLSSTVSTQGASISVLQSASSTQAGQIAELTTRTQAGSPNLLGNGGPEDGVTDWGSSGSLLATFSGSFGMYLRVQSSADSMYINSGRVPIDAGGIYTASADTVFGATAGTMTCRLLFLDASGGEIARFNGATRGGHDFDKTNTGRASNSATGQAPSNAVNALLQVEWNGVSGLTLAGIRQAKIECYPTWTPYSDEASVVQSFTAIATADSQIATLSSTVSTQGASISQNAQAITDTQGNVASLSSTVSAQSASISQNAQAISNTQGDLASLSSTVSTQGALISTLQSASSTQAGQIAQLTTRTQAGSPNLLANGGPENGVTDWATNGTLTAADSGSFGVYLQVQSASASIFVNSARVAIDPTGVYTAAADTVFSASSGTMTCALLFLDGSGAEVARFNAFTRGGHNFDNTNAGRATNAATGQAPSNAVYALFQVSWSGVTGLAFAGVRQAKIENFPIWTPYTDEAAVVQSFKAIATADSQIASLSSTVSTQGSSISQNAQAITDTQGNVASLTSRVSAAESSVSQNAQAISTTQGDLASLSSTVSTQGSSITSLSQTASNHEGRLASAESTISTQGATISQNSQAISTANQNIASVTSRVSAAESSITQNAQAISSVSGRTASLESTVSTQGASISSLQSSTSTNTSDIATLKLSVVAGGGNLLTNTEFAAGLTGWETGSVDMNPGPEFGINGAGALWQLTSSNTASIHQNNATQGTGYADIAQNFPAQAGLMYEASAYYGAHRCTTAAYVQFFDANGGVLSGGGSQEGGAYLGGQDLAQWGRYGFKTTVAPAGTVRGRVTLRKFMTNTGTTDSWLFITRPQVVETTANAVTPQRYASGNDRASIETQATAISNLDGQYASLSSTVSTQGASISQNAQAITSANQTIASLSSTVSSQGATISQNAQAISSLQGDLSTLTTHVRAGSQNLLDNGGPENGLTGWSSADTLSATYSGSFGMYLRVQSSNANFFINSKSVAIDGGGVYTASADTVFGASAGVMACSLIFLNSSGSEVSRVTGTTRGGHDFDNANAGRATNAASGQAPSNAVYALFQVSWSGVSGLNLAGMRQAKIENFSTWTPYSSEASVLQSFTALSTLNTQYASLTSTVSTQGVTITSQQQAITTINGSVTTLFGRAAVTVDVGGVVTGWETNNNGSVGDFKIRADKFSVVPTSNTGARFELRGGTQFGFDENSVKRYQLGDQSLS